MLCTLQLKAATITISLNDFNPTAMQNILDTQAQEGDVINLPSTANATGHKITWSDHPVEIKKGLIINGAGTNLNTGTVMENNQWKSGGAEPSLFQIDSSATGLVEIRNIWFTSTAMCAAGTCTHFDQNNGDCLCVNCAINTFASDPAGTSFPRRIRIHDCVFEKLNWGIMVRSAFGVVDQCFFLDCEIPFRNSGYSNTEFGPGKAVQDVTPFAWDSTNTWCMEDCYVSVSPSVDYKYFADTEWPAAYTIRHCTFDIHRASPYVHGYDGPDMHGTAGLPKENNVGILFYKNIINYTTDAGMNFKLCDIRGGSRSLVYSNTVNILDHQFSVDGLYSVVRCDPAGSIVPTPTYIWNNFSVYQGVTTPIPVDYDDAVIVPGVNFRTYQPKPYPLAEMQYPHPLRNFPQDQGQPPNDP